MDRKFWGPSTWCMIHSAAAGYKQEYRVSFKQFANSLPDLLPCQYCRQNLIKEYNVLPLTDQSLANNKALFMWSYFIHDLVNKRLSKRASPAYPLAEQYYFSRAHKNDFWGPCFWRAIHSFSASYRPAVKQAFKQFVYSLNGIIPCERCKGHFQRNLNQIPLTEDYLKNSHNLFLWSYLLHDLVNRQLGKISPPFEEIKAQYFNAEICGSCGSN